jgi:toxin ParE1/3/4
MSRLRYTSAAWDDLTEIMEYIAADNLSAADRWVEKMQQRCKLIATNPEMGQLRPEYGDRIRSVSVGRFVIFHRLTNDTLEIVRIIPGDQNVTSL